MVAEARILRLGQGVTGIAAQTREPCLIDDITKDPRHTVRATQQSGYRSLLGFPIIMGERLYGVLGVADRTPGKLGDVDRGVAQAVAQQVAAAMESWRLRKTAERSQVRLRSMLNLAAGLAVCPNPDEAIRMLVRGLREIGSADRAALSLVKGDNLVIRSVSTVLAEPWQEGLELPLASTVLAWVIGSKSSYNAPDLAAERRFPTEEKLFMVGLRSHLSLPLVSGGSVFGVFCLSSRQVNAYDAEDRQFLEMMASGFSPVLFFLCHR